MLPSGEWTHTNHRGPAGKFTFHGGTSSAPEGTEIDEIRCSDPGGCSPSGNPPSPVKQLDFDGIGTFKNIGKNGSEPDFVAAGATVTAEGTRRLYELEASPMAEVDMWLSQFRSFWEPKLDALATEVERGKRSRSM